jgi:hypothetical protein
VVVSASQSHHAEGLVNPKVRTQKKVTDFGFPEFPEFPDSPLAKHKKLFV